MIVHQEGRQDTIRKTRGDDITTCEAPRERKFDSCKKKWFAGNLKNSSQESKWYVFFIARILHFLAV